MRRDARRPRGTAELSSAPAAAVMVMSDPTICSPALVSWSRDATLRLVIATNTTGTNSILSSRGPSQAKVGEAMNTNAMNTNGFSDPIVCASVLFHLLMQAIKVGERFHVQHAYATPSDLSYFKRRSTVSRVMRPLSVLDECRPFNS